VSAARLLVLDDEPEVGATIAMLAESAGHVARATVDPAEFLALYDTWRPTHLVVDLVMPEVDGIDVLSDLADQDCTASVIISSGVDGRVRQAAARFAAERGLRIVGVLAKPVGLRELSALVEAGSDAAADQDDPATRRAQPAVAPGPEDLAAALADPEGLHVVYQPKVRCGSQRLAGFEALARWEHPTLGPVPPALFVPLAERHGLVDRLTDRVLATSLAWFATTGPRPGVGLSVNVSALTLADPQFVARVVAHCRAHGVPSSSLTLEITESSEADDALSLHQLTRLRIQGFHLSLDDFGTGYSTMTRLARLPFSEIKIDRSFVSSALVSEESRTVVRTVVELGRNLGLTSVAEGVEDQETLELLDDLGADLAQGFHIARPLPPREARAWRPARG